MALILISASLLNISYIKHIKNRTEALRQTVLMIDYIEISIKYQSLDIEKIFNSLLHTDKYYLLTFINDFVDLNFNLEKYNFTSAKIKRNFSAYSCELLKGFFSMLGKSDVDGQILNCETYKDFFREELQVSEMSEEKKIKTGSSLILGITFIFLIFII